MPLIIKPEDKMRWLDTTLSKEDVEKLMQPYSENDLKAHTVSKLVNRKKDFTNVPEVSQSFSYPDLEFFDEKNRD
ncbi:MAG: SOS response-associated peptidase family protein [Bacteroidetes bacterium]|nr:SOS response-associated peptidase family protein [Bacteroidota bacterium]